MAFDPNFSENFPFLSGIFPETPYIKTETPTMVPLQQSSPLVPPPPNNNTFLYQNNFNHFQSLPFNGANHHPAFPMEDPSSISMIPVPSLGKPYHASYTNGSLRDLANAYYPMTFAPNNNQMELMHGFLSSGQGLWDYTEKFPIQLGASSQPQMGPSLTPSLIYDASGSASMNPGLLDKLPCLAANGNGDWNIDQQKPVALGRRPRRRMLSKTGKNSAKVTNIIKGQWSVDEDKVLTGLVERFGLKRWSHIAKLLNGRIGKQCRERWYNHLRPNIRKDSWDEEEDRILIEAHKQVGNKWAEIARRLPGRSENTIKNHWNATKRRQMAKKKKKNKPTSSKETLLQSYIRQVTEGEQTTRILKKSLKKMKIKTEDCSDDQTLAPAPTPAVRVRYQNLQGKKLICEGGQVQSDVGWNLLQQHMSVAGNGGNAPMMVDADEIAMPNGSVIRDGAMNYGVPMPMGNTVPEVQMK